MRGSFCPINLLWISLVLLQGCASIPKDDLENQVTTGITLDSSSSEAKESGYFQEGEWISENWWEMFQDRQLDHFIQLALKNSPTLKQAESKVELAYQTAKTKKSSLFPTLYADFDDIYAHLSKHGLLRVTPPGSSSSVTPAVINDVILGLNFKYEFDFWGKNLKTFRAALGEAKSTIAEAAQAKLTVSNAVAQAYFTYQANRAKLKINQDMLDRYVKFYSLRGELNEKGLQPLNEPLTARLNVLEIRMNILGLEQDLELNFHQLKLLIGEGPDAEVVIEDKLVLLEDLFPIPKTLSCELLSRRPDLMAQIWHMEAEAHQIGVAKAGFYPNINLMAFAGLDSLHIRNLFNIHSFTGALIPTVSLPIFTGGYLQANLKTKIASFKMAAEEYHQLVLNAAKEVADGVSSLIYLNDQMDVQKDTLKTVYHNYQLSNYRFEGGIGNFLDVLNTEEQFLEQKIVEVDLHYMRILASLALIKALGGGYDGLQFQPNVKEAIPNG